MNFDRWRHYARGWLLHFIGRETAAFGEFVTAYRLQPGDVSAARHLAAIAARQGQLDVAERWFIEVLRLAPDDADSHFNHGYVLEKLGHLDAALTAFGEAVRRNPALDRAWYGMGLAHAGLGQHAAAAAAFGRSVALQPMNGEAFYQLGMAWHHADDPERVRDVVMRLVDFEPRRARKLVQDCGRTDLQHLIPEIPF